MNAGEVLQKVNEMIKEGETFRAKRGYSTKWDIENVYKELAIFDWWNDSLSVNQLKQMKKFLDVAIKLGFDGYVCFKVGARYCSHGMWAYTRKSQYGYNVDDGMCLFHSFRNDDNYYDLRFEDGTWLGKGEKWKFTLAEVKEALHNAKNHI